MAWKIKHQRQLHDGPHACELMVVNFWVSTHECWMSFGLSRCTPRSSSNRQGWVCIAMRAKHRVRIRVSIRVRRGKQRKRKSKKTRHTERDRQRGRERKRERERD